jgi:hypothetical protein
MGRVLLALLFLAPTAGLVLMPTADPVRAAAEDAWPSDAGDASYLALAEAVFASPAVRAEEGRRALRLGGVRFTTDQPTSDPTLHGAARDSIALGLEEAAVALGREIAIEGGWMPVDGGADFLVEHRGGELVVSCAHPEVGEIARASRAAPGRGGVLGRPPWLVAAGLGGPLIGWVLLAKRPGAKVRDAKRSSGSDADR